MVEATEYNGMLLVELRLSVVESAKDPMIQ
jgi:hypothetical protein